MGQLSESEAIQLWGAAMDHAQAVLAVDASARRAALTGTTEHDMKNIHAQNELENRRQSLLAHIRKHVGEREA